MDGILIITHGLPGSGKSTWAESEVTQDPTNRIRVNRDDIRTTLFGEEYHRGNFPKQSEQQVTTVQHELIRRGLTSGKRVYCDDTNLNPGFISHLVKIAKDTGTPIEQEYFNVSVEECKRRNALRGANGGRQVPDFVIDNMASRAYSNGEINDFIIGATGSVWSVARVTEGKRILDKFNEDAVKKYPMRDNSVVIVDVDGTLANNSKDADRAFGVSGAKKNYPLFFRSIENAPVNTRVRDLANTMRSVDKLNIVVLTGRSDENAKELVSFIERSGLHVSRVIAKRKNDYRPDSEFKAEQIKKLKADGLVPVHAIDDRPRSIATWESFGILVSKVEYHEPQDPSKSPLEYPEPPVDTIYGTGHCIRCGAKLKNGGNIGPKCRLK